MVQLFQFFAYIYRNTGKIVFNDLKHLQEYHKNNKIY